MNRHELRPPPLPSVRKIKCSNLTGAQRYIDVTIVTDGQGARHGRAAKVD
jgi:hypothetical protein